MCKGTAQNTHLPSKVHRRTLVYYHKTQKFTSTTAETTTSTAVKVKSNRSLTREQEVQTFTFNNTQDQDHLDGYSKQVCCRCNITHSVQGRCLAYGPTCSKCHWRNCWTVSCHSGTPSSDITLTHTYYDNDGECLYTSPS